MHCVPCEEKGKPNVVAMRYVPVKGRGNVPMCESCWGGGVGPGVSKAAAVEEPAKKPTAAAAAPAPPPAPPPQSPSRPHRSPNGGHEAKIAREERYAKMQADRDGGMPLRDIAKKYQISYASVTVYTRSPKGKEQKKTLASYTEQPSKKPESRKDPVVTRLNSGVDFSALLEDLQHKREECEARIREIDKAIEAVNVVKNILVKSDGLA